MSSAVLDRPEIDESTGQFAVHKLDPDEQIVGESAGRVPEYWESYREDTRTSFAAWVDRQSAPRPVNLNYIRAANSTNDSIVDFSQPAARTEPPTYEETLATWYGVDISEVRALQDQYLGMPFATAVARVARDQEIERERVREGRRAMAYRYAMSSIPFTRHHGGIY